MNKISACGLASLALLLSGGAHAQAYPTKTVRILVGFAAGGSVDLVGRTIAQKLTTTYGRQVVVDNRPGAASHIAGQLATKADPDGYTLLVSSQGGLGTNLAIYKQMPYNPLKELTPLALLVRQGQVVLVNPSVPARTIKELIALAKQKPGQITFGSAGVGGPLHVAVELFHSLTGTKMTHVVYKGGAPALIDLLGGQIDVTFQPIPEALPYLKTNRVRALAMTGDKRSHVAPDVPTVAEAGVPGYAFESWMGAAGPAGIPRDLAAKISADINAALKSPDVSARLQEFGLEIAGSTPDELGAHMREQVAKMQKLVKDANIPLID